MTIRADERSAWPRVLLVDDEPELTTGLMRALADEPYEFLSVESGEAALELLARGGIDVVVADDQMPGMRGTELLSRVRMQYPSVIRIILTGNASVSSAMKAIREGWVYQYLHKPCHPADLALVLYTALMMRSLIPPDAGEFRMPSREEEQLLDDISRARVKERAAAGLDELEKQLWRLE